MIERLAVGLVRIKLVTGVARAEVALAHPRASLRVLATLAALAWWIALVSIDASPCVVLAQLLPWGTSAQRSLWGLHTSVAAARFGATTVIVVAKRSLVGTIGTVRLIVTHLAKGNADIRNVVARTSVLSVRTRLLN